MAPASTVFAMPKLKKNIYIYICLGIWGPVPSQNLEGGNGAKKLDRVSHFLAG